MNKWLTMGRTPESVLIAHTAAAKPIEGAVKKVQVFNKPSFDYLTIATKLAEVFPNGFAVRELEGTEIAPNMKHWSQFIQQLRYRFPDVIRVLRREVRPKAGGYLYIYQIIPEMLPALEMEIARKASKAAAGRSKSHSKFN